MADFEGHLWTESFLRLISQSNDEKKLRALQQIILHNQGKEQIINGSFSEITNIIPKPPRKISPKKSTMEISPKTNQNLSPLDVISNSTKIQKPKRLFENNNSQKLSSPIMGKWALLTKYNNMLKDNNNDAEIVTKIVMEKFKSILNNYHKRSFMRKKTNEDIEEKVNFADTQLVLDDNAKTDSSESPKEPHLVDTVYQAMEPIWEEDEFEILEQEENEASEKNKNEDLNQIIPVHGEQLFEEDLVGAKNPNLCDYEKLKEEKLFEEKIEYDAQKFLEEALGEELYDYSSVKSDNEERETSFRCEPRQIEDGFSSVNTSQISDLCRASMYLFNILSGKNRKPISTNPSSAISYEELFTDNQSHTKASNYIREAAVQNQIILQTCKALNFCENSKQFKSSMEYIEAEKILLLATLKYEAVRKELHKTEYEELKDLGQITVSNLKFPVEAPTTSNEYSQWCFAVISCGSIVLATETIKAENEEISFDKSFNLEHLDVDFELTISIYVLYVKNYKNQDLKFHTKQETTCPYPINRLLNFRKLNKNSKLADDYERRHPSFLLWGTCSIRIADLNKPDPFKLTRIPNGSILKGIMTADISSAIELTGTYSGFLTIGSEAGGYATWNRRWCQLNGYELQYWNYPGEEEHTKPIGIIDLRFCVVSRINQVDRELCARPRTLLLETGRLSSSRDKNSLMVICRSSYTITKHYLSADKHQEMIKWQNKLNSVVSVLRNWNCMKCQLYFSR